MRNKELPPLSVQEAARLLRISSRTVRRLVDRGVLHATQVGGVTVLLRSEFRQAVGLDADASSDALTPLLAPLEAAERLGCSPQELRRLVGNGRLAPVRLGTLYRYRADALARLTNRFGPDAPGD